MTWFSPSCQLDIQSIAVMAGEGSRRFKHLPWHRPSAARSDSPSGAASPRPQKLGQLEGWAATASVWKFEATKMEIWRDWQEVNPIYRRSTISRFGSVGCSNHFLDPNFDARRESPNQNQHSPMGGVTVANLKQPVKRIQNSQNTAKRCKTSINSPTAYPSLATIY